MEAPRQRMSNGRLEQVLIQVFFFFLLFVAVILALVPLVRTSLSFSS